MRLSVAINKIEPKNRKTALRKAESGEHFSSRGSVFRRNASARFWEWQCLQAESFSRHDKETDSTAGGHPISSSGDFRVGVI